MANPRSAAGTISPALDQQERCIARRALAIYPAFAVERGYRVSYRPGHRRLLADAEHILKGVAQSREREVPSVSVRAADAVVTEVAVEAEPTTSRSQPIADLAEDRSSAAVPRDLTRNSFPDGLPDYISAK
ncbi:hypothetical protein [Vitreimonas flagellata]|uniref:hypothetical protein n=1 Tax=Vitreimonas flagellata TaxID=2560861 RepID=UPI00143181F8|nr:hypothetical protein [Vitreimonas flagellata]